MALAIDGTSPVRWTGTSNFTAGDVSASFTAPANALLVVCVEYDTDSTPGAIVVDVTDSGGLTWTRQIERTGAETTAGGGAAIWTARTTTAVARTIRLAYNPAESGDSGTARKSARCYVVTGADVDGTPVDTVGANNEGGSSTNNLTTASLTPGASGFLFAADLDWQTQGAFEASSDLTQDTANYAGEVSVCDGYKACTSGVAVTANLNAGGTGTPQHKWCQIIVREAAGGGEEGPPINVRLDEPELGSGEFE